MLDDIETHYLSVSISYFPEIQISSPNQHKTLNSHFVALRPHIIKLLIIAICYYRDNIVYGAF